MTGRCSRVLVLVMGAFLSGALLMAAEVEKTQAQTKGIKGKNDPNWTQFRGPNRDGFSHDSNWTWQWPKEGPPILWKASLGTGVSSVVVRDSRLYTMGRNCDNDVVYCLNTDTGKEIWRLEYPCPICVGGGDLGGPAGTPSLDGLNLYTISRAADLYCIDTKTGKALWEKHLEKEYALKRPGNGFTCSPLVDGNRVVVEVGRTISLNKKTGDLIWKTDDFGTGNSSPNAITVKGVRYIAVFNALGPFIFRADNGAEVCRLAWDNRAHIATPLAVGERLFFAAYYGKGSALVEIAPGKPNVIWATPKMQNLIATSVFYKGCFYGIDEQSLACQDAETGAIKWSWPKGNYGWGTLTATADGKLLVLSVSGELQVVEMNSTEYKLLASATPLKAEYYSEPVLAHGRIYLRTNKGELLCLDVRAKGK